MFAKNYAEASAGKSSRIIQSIKSSTPFLQRGSILIGLIMTMVVMATLGLGMLYMTSTSTFNSLFFSSNSESFYAAESGGRYAVSVINANCATGTCSAAQAALTGKTFDLGNDSRFQISNWQLTTDEYNTATIAFSSTGTVGSGFLHANRQVDYIVQPANQGGYTLPVRNLEPNMENFNTSTPWAGTFSNAGGVMTVVATEPESSTGNNRGTSNEYRAYSEYTKLNYSSYYIAQGGSLGYDAQVKVRSTTDYFMTGLAFRTHPLYAQTGDNTAARLDPRGFNLSIMRSGGNAVNEGIPLEMIDWSGDGLINIDPNWTAGDYYIVLWMDKGSLNPFNQNGVNDNGAPMELMLAYKKLDANSGVFTETIPFSDDMESGINGWTANPEGTTGGWAQTTTYYNSSNHSWGISLAGSSRTSSLMSRQIDASATPSGTLSFSYSMPDSNRANQPIVRICKNVSCTTYSDLSFSPSENSSWHAVSIPVSGLTSTTYIKFIASTRSYSSARLQLYIDDVKISSNSLTEWPTLLVRILEKNLVSGDNTSRRNIITAYYSTPTANPAGNTATDHTYAYDDFRLGSNPQGTYNWPPATGTNGNFTMIKWDWIKGCGFATANYASCATTAPLYTDATDGSGNGAIKGTVLKTKFFRTRSAADATDGWGSFVVTAGYAELGLSVFSRNGSNNLFFDDFAVNISNGGGQNGTGQVIVYP